MLSELTESFKPLVKKRTPDDGTTSSAHCISLQQSIGSLNFKFMKSKFEFRYIKISEKNKIRKSICSFS